jgi:hypothetical protein
MLDNTERDAALIAVNELLDQLHAVVNAAVIYKDAFHTVLIGLVSYGIETLEDIFLDVIDGYNDGNVNV